MSATASADAEPAAVQIRGLCKNYGRHRVLDHIDLTVRPGTVHALLGPNGAGKTTIVRIAATLARYDAGTVRVLGRDASADAPAVRSRLGLTGQFAALDQLLTGRENLELFGRLSGLGARQARQRSGELLERFGLAGAADKTPAQYSGGMRRRLDIAAGTVQQPRLLVLDEPTTGLDPAARADVWDLVRELVGGGTTVLLTTQYLEEADRLADRVTVIDRGRVVAEGTPEELKAQSGPARIEAGFAGPGEAAAAAAVLAPLGAEHEGRRVVLPATEKMAALMAAVRALDAAGLVPYDLAVRGPDLDEAFLALTGAAAPAAPAAPERVSAKEDA